MISLKPRTRQGIIDLLMLRARKFALILDPEDYSDLISLGIRALDNILFNPRTVILENTGTRVDVSALHIDEICNVYFPPQNEINFMFKGLGVIPFISSSTKFNTLEGVVDYLTLKSNLNMMNRHMNLDGDYQLWPTATGQELQFNNNYALVWLEYLPHIDASQDEWQLYENEFSWLVESVWCDVNIRNAEMALSASPLGVGKEMEPVLNHWSKKKEGLDTAFRESSVIAYLG